MKLTPRQTADCLVEIEQLAARLRALEPDLRHRAQGIGLDGYPRQSGAGTGGGGDGDPVGTIVAFRMDHPEHDSLGHAHRQVLDHLHRARRLLEEAESAGLQALPPPARRNLDDSCVSCARIPTWSPISRARRCRWCSDWVNAHQGDDPPIDILRAHHEGRRITTRLADVIIRHRRT